MSESKIVAEARKMLDAGKPTDVVLKMMRDRGMSKVMSIKALAELGAPLAEAKIMVHDSGTWSDVRDSHDRFSTSIAQALGEPGSDGGEDI